MKRQVGDTPGCIGSINKNTAGGGSGKVAPADCVIMDDIPGRVRARPIKRESVCVKRVQGGLAGIGAAGGLELNSVGN